MPSECHKKGKTLYKRSSENMLPCFQKGQEEYTFTFVGGSQAHGAKGLRAVGAVMVDRLGLVVEFSINQHPTSEAWAIDLSQSG